MARERIKIPITKRWILHTDQSDETFHGSLSDALKEATTIAIIESGWPSRINRTISVLIVSDEPKPDSFKLILSTPKRQKRG